MKISRFWHIAIVTQDLPKMVDFYTRVMGFKAVREMPVNSEVFRKGISLPNADGRVITLEVPNSSTVIDLFEFKEIAEKDPLCPVANRPGYRHIAFLVEDLDVAAEELKAEGIELFSKPLEVAEPPMVAGFKFLYFKDPEGNIIELSQPPEKN